MTRVGRGALWPRRTSEAGCWRGGEARTLPIAKTNKRDSDGQLVRVEELHEPAQVERPALAAFERATGVLPALTMTVELPMLELDSRVSVVDGGEGHFDLTSALGIGL